MNILLCSVPFRPSVGGIETVSALLAECFHRMGHQVVVVTQTPGNEPDAESFELVRQPSTARMFELVRWADVVFHNNISLKFAWPQMLLRRPWVVAHHTWIPATGMAAGLKRWAIRHASNIAVSHAVAESLPVDCTIVPNPYADDVFVGLEDLERSRELVFVGRLVSDKGVNVLIDALGLLATRGRRVGLTLIGDGPELPALRRQVDALGISSQVHFAGRRTGADLVAALNEHQVLVVPSVWQEPFGVVALEAMACGCVPLVSRSGGLPDAAGAAGVVFEPSDSQALAQAIEELLDDPALIDRLRAAGTTHLARHTRDRVARDYLQVMADACRSRTPQSAPRAV
jgi:glycosyltransferase involved in cell wall biosynthesis